MDIDTDDNSERQIWQLAGKIQALTDLYMSLNSRVNELEKDIESLNNLCKFSFKSAFNRIGRLERGEKVNDMGLDIEGEDISGE